MKQIDLADLHDGKESEIYKWLIGTHIYTIDTITNIEILSMDRGAM